MKEFTYEVVTWEKVYEDYVKEGLQKGCREEDVPSFDLWMERINQGCMWCYERNKK